MINTSFLSSAKTNITPREKQVLYLIAYEHSTKEIASKLFVSYETISSHRQNLMRKLAVKNTAGLVRVAFEKCLLQISEQRHTKFSTITNN